MMPNGSHKGVRMWVSQEFATWAKEQVQVTNRKLREQGKDEISGVHLTRWLILNPPQIVVRIEPNRGKKGFMDDWV